MKQIKKSLALLALCLLSAMVPAVTAEEEPEEEILFALPVDEIVEDTDPVEFAEEEPEEDAEEPALAVEGDVPIDEAHFPDATFRAYVQEAFDIDPADGVLSADERAAVTAILVNSRDIASLEGVACFPALTELDCGNNRLTDLDVSENTALKMLFCNDNQLASLDVSGFVAMTDLRCNNNQLTSLDVSRNTALGILACSNNQLTSLDMSHNPALKEVYCSKNQLTSLDVSGNTALEELYCYGNQLTTLDVGGLTKLYWLACNDNRLLSLDVNGCTDLYILESENNQLRSIDLANCPSLINCIRQGTRRYYSSYCSFLKDFSCIHFDNFTILTAGDETLFMPEATLEPTPSPTPDPTPETTPEATPETSPEASPEAGPEALPTPTPEADPTPEITPTPTPEVTPTPTPEPSPTPEAGPSPEPTVNLADFQIDENGVLVKYLGSSKDVVIPDGVTEIGASAFFKNRTIEKITIPGSVKRIGSRAFYSSTVSTVDIADGVTFIATWAFRDCASLRTIRLPDTLSAAQGVQVFDGVTYLKEVTAPARLAQWLTSEITYIITYNVLEGVTEIKSGEFANINLLQTVVLPDGVTSIAAKAFYKCKSLSNIHIPASVTSIGTNAFAGCPTSLKAYTACETYGTTYMRQLGATVVASDHNPVNDPAVAATCSSTGLTAGTHCSACGRVLSGRAAVPTLPHTPVADPAVPATCTATGLTAGSHCAVCLKILTEQREAPMLPHTPVVDPAVPATLTSTGLTAGSHCGVCGTVIVARETVPRLIDVANAKVTIKAQVYTGKALKPAPVVKLNGVTLKKGTDYTVTYKNNKAIGTATATIKGKGSYTGSVKATFKIKPKAVTLSKLTAGKQKLTVQWKKGSGITGYEIQYSLKKNMSGAKTVTVKKAATVKTTIKKLKSKKTYYVRIRAYKTVSKKNYYSAWSKVKSAKVK